MSVSSTFTEFPSDTSSSSSNHSVEDQGCAWSSLDIQILTAFYITNILLIVPLSALVLFFGWKRWRARPPTVATHSDVFTFHMVVMEMIIVAGSLVFCVGLYTELDDVRKYGYQIFSASWCAKMSFHSLTCVERYLAVVHPIAYLRLRNDGGVRVRNICIGCVWLLCLLFAVLVALTGPEVNMIMYLCFVALSLGCVCFCSVSVLWALRRPSPGEAVKDGKQVDQMKRRAFHTIVTITGALMFCFGGMLACDSLEASRLLDRHVGCAVLTSAVWFSLPGSLVLPLLFLQRVVTPSCCQRTTG